MKKLRFWALIPVMVVAAIVGLSVPAQAASASVTGDGATASVSVTGAHASGLNIPITATDTKCNAHPAATDVGIYGTSGRYDYVYFTNSSGCHGGARSYTTG